MATGQFHFWGPYYRDILRGIVAVESASRYKALLTTSAFTPNLDSSQMRSDVSGELYGGDWPQGGVIVPNVVVTQLPGSDEVVLTHDPISVAEVTLSDLARRVIYYDDTGGSPATKRLAFTVLYDQDFKPNAGPVVITSPNGIVRGVY